MPPIWVAANGDRAVARAGRLGLPWVINPHASLGIYRAALAGAGHSPADLPIIREVVIHRRREEAWELAARYLWPKYRVYVEWGYNQTLPVGSVLRAHWKFWPGTGSSSGRPRTVSGRSAATGRNWG